MNFKQRRQSRRNERRNRRKFYITEIVLMPTHDMGATEHRDGEFRAATWAESISWRKILATRLVGMLLRAFHRSQLAALTRDLQFAPAEIVYRGAKWCGSGESLLAGGLSERAACRLASWEVPGKCVEAVPSE